MKTRYAVTPTMPESEYIAQRNSGRIATLRQKNGIQDRYRT